MLSNPKLAVSHINCLIAVQQSPFPAWLPHIAASVIDRVVMQAMNKAIDPRVHMDAINFDSWGSQILSGDDLKKIWVYISREVNEQLIVKLT